MFLYWSHGALSLHAVTTNTCVQVPPPAPPHRSEHIPPQPPPKKKPIVPPPTEVHPHPATQPPRDTVAVGVSPPSPAMSVTGVDCRGGGDQDDDLLSSVSSAPTVEHFNISVSCHINTASNLKTSLDRK